MEKIEIKIKKNEKIRDFLLNYGFSKSETNKIIKNKDVKVDGVRMGEDAILKAGTIATVYASTLPQAKFKILYQDENVVVIDKASGIETQGPNGVERLIDGAIAVHRLDRNTSGVMIFAKNSQSEEELKAAFKQKTVEKKYVCEVFGKPKFSDEVYKGFLLKDSARSQVKVFSNFVQGAVSIETRLTTLKQTAETSVVMAEPLTGRTHQIRAHLAYLGYPIIGDGKYGKNEINKKFKENNQKLHCFSLIFKKLGKKLNYLENKAFISKPEWAKKIV